MLRVLITYNPTSPHNCAYTHNTTYIVYIMFYFFYEYIIVTGVNTPFAKQTLGWKLFGTAQLSYDEKLGHNIRRSHISTNIHRENRTTTGEIEE